DAQIDAALDGADGKVAKHIARKLIQHDGESQRAVVARLPRTQLAVGRRLPQIEETPANLRIKGVVPGEPPVRPGVTPECEDISRREAASVAHLSFAPGCSSRRGLLLVAQFAAQDLSDIGLRQRRAKLDLLRHFVVGELGAAEFYDVLGG